MPHNPYRSVPLFFKGRIDEHLRTLGSRINDLLRGRSNNADSVTLTPDATSTVVLDDRVTSDTVALLQPCSASAAAATGVYNVTATGQVTITHDSDPATDRIFGIVLVG